jgi:hypothetical protein
MKTTRLTLNDFIEKSKLVHGDKYDYSLVEYKNNKQKIKIICPEHGEFEQTPKNHMNGKHCKKCGSANTGLKKRANINNFIETANLIHENKYDYSLVEYQSAIKKIKIICPVHGIFEQQPSAHVSQKQGCPSCYQKEMIDNGGTWTAESWNRIGKSSKHFDGFKLYVIRCFNDDESFIKIGKTFNRLKRRFSQIPYQYEVLKVIESNDGVYIHKLEARLKNKYKHLQYLPIINFGGKYECYSTM